MCVCDVVVARTHRPISGFIREELAAGRFSINETRRVRRHGKSEVAIVLVSGPRLFGDGRHNNRMHFPFVQFPAVITSGASLSALPPRRPVLSSPPLLPLPRSPSHPPVCAQPRRDLLNVARRQSKNCFCTHFRGIARTLCPAGERGSLYKTKDFPFRAHRSKTLLCAPPAARGSKRLISGIDGPLSPAPVPHPWL